jgi:hypothetical protein
MKASTKKYLMYGAAAYAVYYWYKNYGPGKPVAGDVTAPANTAAQAIGQAAMATQNALYSAASQIGQ